MKVAYLNLSKKELEKRVKLAREMLENCRVCPRKCGVNRLKDERGLQSFLCFLSELAD